MPVIAAVGLFFQVFFTVHAVKTGRERYWLYVLIFFPGVGCLIYFFSEYLPDLRQGRRMHAFKTAISRALNPGRHLRRLQEQVEVTPSVKNKKLLAEGHALVGLNPEVGHMLMGYEDPPYAFSLIMEYGRLAHTHWNSQPLGNYDQDLNVGVISEELHMD